MKKIGLIIILLILIIASLLMGIHFYKQSIYDSLQIVFKNNIQIEYGDEVDFKDYIDSYEGEIKDISTIDTMKIGYQEVRVTLIKKDVERVFEKKVMIVDTQRPIIEFKKDQIVIGYGQEYDPNENIERVYDVIDGELDYQIDSSLDSYKPNTYYIKVSCHDINGNKTTKEFSVQVKEEVKVIQPSNSIKATYINGILLVNKKYALPSTFGNGVDPTAYEALKKLQAAAKKEGYSLDLVSGFRSYETQKSTYQYWCDVYGEEYAQKISAKAGHSEHQSGLAFDVGSLKSSFGDTAAGKWLASHCAEFGFILRYPKDKTDITGYYYEPWHIRYVGVEHSIPIMEKGLTLEEYLGVVS
ncbi:MAG: D-alanyl-D-alanine carboxypeptidase family protein [Traorella sp.]